MLIREYTQDVVMVKEVFVDNEYQLPRSFPADAIILDIGAHIGCFALACAVRGARRVICYEPDALNVQILRNNAIPYGDAIEAHHAAVWRSDRVEQAYLVSHVEPFYTAIQQVNGVDGDKVASVGLDQVLTGLPVVDLCKLDCEGSEYPILFTSTMLSRIRSIVVETHRHDVLYKPVLDLPHPCTPAGLTGFLEGAGFDVRLVLGNHENNSLIFGTRGA